MKKLSSCRVILTGLGLLGVVMTFAGCATDDVPVDRTAMLSSDDRVSNVPWNKPQGWENRGSLGALANDPRIGGSQ